MSGKGHILSKEDPARYQKLVVALNETIRIMDEIDEVIGDYCGWPYTFQDGIGAAAAVANILFQIFRRPPV